MNKEAKIYIAGHRGMVGSAILRKFKNEGYTRIITRTHQELDLQDQKAVENFFAEEKPEYVILAAAKVGGIVANNTYRAQFIYENLMIQNNVIHQSYVNGVKKLIFLGSSCIYPKNAPQPIKEESLLSSELEQTNEPYAIAKITGLKLCESYDRQYGTNFFSVMPCNLYGPEDNFHLKKSHVLSALLRKMHLASCLERNDWETIRKDLTMNPIDEVSGNSGKEEILKALDNNGVHNSPSPIIDIWGTGTVLREFLYVEDLAEAVHFLFENYNVNNSAMVVSPPDYFYNVGSGVDITIRDLASIIKNVTGFKGEFNYDTSKPDGTYKKLLDVSKIGNFGWKQQTSLDNGISKMYDWYLQKINQFTGIQ